MDGFFRTIYLIWLISLESGEIWGHLYKNTEVTNNLVSTSTQNTTVNCNLVRKKKLEYVKWSYKKKAVRKKGVKKKGSAFIKAL